MKRLFEDYIFLIFSFVASAISIFAYVKYVAPKLNDQGLGGVVFLGILCFLFLGYSIYLVGKYRKKIQYSEIFEDLNLSFAKIHFVNRQEITDPDKKLDSLTDSLSELCNGISDCFTKINGHHIGVCIKYLERSDEQHPIAQSLARDKKSKGKNRKTGKADKRIHWLKQNSDFRFIYLNYENDNVDTSHYHGTFLPNKNNYENTRLPDEWPPKKTYWPLNWIIRQKTWSLDYRSTMVVPIVPLMADEQSKNNVRGFLCIDSPKNNAFYKHPDTEILRGIADGIYTQMNNYHKILNEE